MEATCTVDGCDRPVNAREFCKNHYYRFNRYGDPLGKPGPRPARPPKPKQPCTVEDCDRPQYGLGLCEAHYARRRRHGGLHDKRAESRDPHERFAERVDLDGPISSHGPGTPCHLWTGPANGAGYGYFKMGGRSFGAHVAAVLLSGDEVPPGHEPDHLCLVKLCVRRDHLEVVTAAENKRRAVSRTDQVGNDGLTDSERAEALVRFRFGVGSREVGDEQEAAVRYWRMLGHDLPASERVARHRRFATDAPLLDREARTEGAR